MQVDVRSLLLPAVVVVAALEVLRRMVVLARGPKGAEP